MCRPGLLCPSGAFLPGLPVQPVVLRYTNSLVNTNTPPSSDPPSSLLPCRPHSPDFTCKRSPQEVAYGSEVTASVSSFPPRSAELRWMTSSFIQDDISSPRVFPLSRLLPPARRWLLASLSPPGPRPPFIMHFDITHFPCLPWTRLFGP